MRTGARLPALDAASLSLLRVVQELDDGPERLSAALGDVAAAAGLAPARRGAHEAGEALVPRLRALRDGVRALGDDVTRQAVAFRATDLQ